MRAKKLRTKVVGLVAAVMVVGAPLTAWAIDVAGGDLTPRAGLFVPPYFIHFFKERGVCYEKIFKDFYFP